MEFLRRLFATDISQKQPTPQQPEGTSKLAATQSLSSNSRLIILLGIVMIAGLWLFVGLQINADYDRTITETSTETQNLAKAFEEHVRRILVDADNDLLQGAVDILAAAALGLQRLDRLHQRGQRPDLEADPVRVVAETPKAPRTAQCLLARLRRRLWAGRERLCAPGRRDDPPRRSDGRAQD